MRQMIAGNWKMNGTLAGLAGFAAPLASGVDGVDLLICPPFPLIGPMIAAFAGAPVAVGAQDCAVEVAGAHTGDVSAALLAEVGASHVILG
ncbi:MAG: triose-phosphate isomerase, partial [Acidiphilium sp.]|nr:triose-phosphate isomerase [Acidiphilium sp.]